MTRARIGAVLAFVGIVGLAYSGGSIPNAASFVAVGVGVACLLFALADRER